MTFSDFLKILMKYYEPYIEPHYNAKKVSGADFVRELFISATVGSYDLFPDVSLAQKIYSGKRKISKSKAGKVISDLDKENFINFLDILESDDARCMLCMDFDIKSNNKSILYEHIYNCFLNYIKDAATTKKQTENISMKNNTI